MTRACAVDHVRYTRALTGRSDMPSALPPGAMYAVEHDFLSSAVEAAAGDMSYARSLALGAARRGAGHGPRLLRRSSPSTRRPATAPRRPAAELLDEVPAAEGRLLPALVAAVGALAGGDSDRLEAVGDRWRSWAACCTPPS